MNVINKYGNACYYLREWVVNSTILSPDTSGDSKGRKIVKTIASLILRTIVATPSMGGASIVGMGANVLQILCNTYLHGKKIVPAVKGAFKNKELNSLSKKIKAIVDAEGVKDIVNSHKDFWRNAGTLLEAAAYITAIALPIIVTVGVICIGVFIGGAPLALVIAKAVLFLLPCAALISWVGIPILMRAGWSLSNLLSTSRDTSTKLEPFMLTDAIMFATLPQA